MKRKKNQRMNAANAKAKNNFGALSNQVVAPNHMSNTLGKRGIVVATGGSNSESALDNGLDPVNPDITNP